MDGSAREKKGSFVSSYVRLMSSLSLEKKKKKTFGLNNDAQRPCIAH